MGSDPKCVYRPYLLNVEEILEKYLLNTLVATTLRFPLASFIPGKLTITITHPSLMNMKDALCSRRNRIIRRASLQNLPSLP